MRRIMLFLFAVFVLSVPLLVKGSGKVERGGYWRDKDTFVTEYSIPAVSGGEGRFIDIEGNRWETSDSDIRAGETCILYISDNGTEMIEDDIVLEIKK